MFAGKPPGGGNGIPLGMFGGGWPFANGGGKGGMPLPPGGMAPFGPGPCMPKGGGGIPASKLVDGGQGSDATHLGSLEVVVESLDQLVAAWDLLVLPQRMMRLWNR